MPSVANSYQLEFTIFFVAPPETLGVVLIIMGVLGLVWLYKWGNSMITGSGGS